MTGAVRSPRSLSRKQQTCCCNAAAAAAAAAAHLLGHDSHCRNDSYENQDEYVGQYIKMAALMKIYITKRFWCRPVHEVTSVLCCGEVMNVI